MRIGLPGTKSCTNGQALPACIIALAVFLEVFGPTTDLMSCPCLPANSCIQKQDHLFAAIPLQVSAADGIDHCMYLLPHSLRQRALLSTVVAALYVMEAVCAVQL